MGSLLVTDWKKNLHEMFEPGKEVVAYRSAEECAEMVQYYLERIGFFIFRSPEVLVTQG
jgi:spore maturation protein CgeB